MKYIEKIKPLIEYAENTIVGFYILDENLNFVYVNPSFCKILSYKKDEIIGKNILDFLSFPDEKEKDAIEKKLSLEKSKEVFTILFVDKKGNVKYCEVSSQIKEIDDKKFVMGVIVDITDRIEYHRRLEETFKGTISAFSKIVEVRDQYTAGHQLRVSDIAVKIAKQMNMEKEKIREIKIAGLLHDIGKISIPNGDFICSKKTY